MLTPFAEKIRKYLAKYFVCNSILLLVFVPHFYILGIICKFENFLQITRALKYTIFILKLEKRNNILYNEESAKY